MAASDQDVDHVSSSDRLLDEIGHSIISGEFQPGSRLTEADLAKRFGVSRAPLREALLRLQERQLIERVPFSGTRVFEPTPRMLSELYEMREVLEGFACRRAAERITEDQIAALQKLLCEEGQRIKEIGKWEAARTPPLNDFHSLVAQAGGNIELQRLLNKEIWSYLRSLYRRWARPLGRVEMSLHEHQQILDALGRRDGEMAELLMRRHISGARKLWEEST